jgi:hypothetical protein
MTTHGLQGITDAGAFLARLVRLDPATVVRLQPAAGRTALWARLPWQVLVCRSVDGAAGLDVTVAADELLAALTAGSGDLPTRRDERWRWPLPPQGGVEVLDTVDAVELAGLAAAAAGTLREAATVGVAGRTVGQRALRDALLDHVALRVTRQQGPAVEVPQRLVQAVSRMGFLGTPTAGQAWGARVCVVGTWTGIAAPYGVAWMQRATTLTLMPVKTQPFG